MIESDSEERDDDERREPSPREPRTGAPAGGGRPSGSSLLYIYKPGQGSYVRWSTAIGMGVLGLAFAWFLADQMALLTTNQLVQTLVPVAGVAALAVLIFWLVGQKREFVDFLIATEGEMKKVNWSTRREVLGATKVVIVTVLALGMILFIVDVAFMSFFSAIGVLKINVIQALFGPGGGG